MCQETAHCSVLGMYIRRTQTRNTATGERYFTHRLVRSERVGGKVRQVTLLNLGRHFPVPQSDWPTLCARLEEILSGQGVLLAGSGSLLLEREAQRLAALLLARQGVATTEAPAAGAPLEVQTLEVDSLTLRWEISDPIQPGKGGLIRFRCRVR